MTEMLLAGIAALAAVVVVLVVLRARRTEPALVAQFQLMKDGQDRLERVLREEFGRSRDEAAAHGQQLRNEVGGSLRSLNDSVIATIGQMASLQRGQLETFALQLGSLAERNEQRMEVLLDLVETKLTELRADNTQQLERMRATVDEKLHATLEQRLGETFRLVSERLDQVHRGLGEMQALANGVGDLKRMLTNVKTRGTWGEMQLSMLLEQVLSPGQYAVNIATKDSSSERVEFAIKLPGRNGRDDECVWLPIDAKFPQEEFQRLQDAHERADSEVIAAAGKRLESQIRSYAKSIRDKYVSPPSTTDFGIMYLPTEGLYAEVVRRAGLVECMQRDHRVVVAGPSTLAALLNSLQMGFRTLAVEQRSSEVWALLGAVKAEFNRFGDVLERVHRKLGEASNTIETAAQKSRLIERKLREVQELPAAEAQTLLSESIGEADGVPRAPYA